MKSRTPDKKLKLDFFVKKIEPYVYMLPTIGLMALLLFVPIIMVIAYSFFDNVIINDNPVFVGITNYITVLSDGIFLKSCINTAMFVILNVIAHLILGMSLAMLVNAKSLKPGPKAAFRIIFMLPWMFNATVIAILWKLLLNGSGIINYLLINFNLSSFPVEWLSNRHFALWVLTFINIWAGYPFYMISILAGLQGIPSTLYEASNIDGAGSVQRFFNITLPQLKPILISITMLDFIWTTQNFSLIWLLTAGGPAHATEMMSTYVYKTAFQRYEYSQASAAAVIILIICVILAVFYVRSQRRED